MNKLFISISSIILGGCASVYIPPSANEAQANLAIPVIKSEWSFFGGASGGGVQVAVPDQTGCGKFSKIIDTKNAVKDFSIKIPADKKVFISVFHFQGDYKCKIVGSFNPKPNIFYTLDFNYLSDYCIGTLTEKQEDNKEVAVRIDKAFASGWDGIKVCDVESKP